MKHYNLFTLLFSLICLGQLSAQDTPLWLRYPAISPDGSTILFNYKGDIYKVPASGGTAVPLTISDSYEYSAVWSNDGKQIAFASDRYGNFDVFVMPAQGGEAKRLTFHSNSEKPSAFSPDGQNIIFSGLRQDLHTNVQFPSGVMSELYSVPVDGGRVSQVLTSPAHDAVYSPDGKKIIFHDRKGYENDWRKHHTSSVTRDIWVYDLDSKDYQQLSSFEGENRNPVFTSNGDDFYYLSEQNGDFNVYQSALSNPNNIKQLTYFEKHPVRFLTLANDNTACFSYDGEIYTMKSGGQPVKVAVQIGFDGMYNVKENVSVNKGITEGALSPNGKEFAYVHRGEIFVSSIESGTTKRVTNTPWQERSVSFSPDGRSLVYAAEVDNSWNVYTSSIVREEEPYFYVSTVLKEEVVIATGAEEFQPSYSPDGKEVAYLENRTTLKVVNLASKQARTIMPAEYNYSYADGDQWYQWSPDSKWFLVEFGQKDRIFWTEIGLVSASGKGEIKNLTLSGYADFVPMWAMGGEMMIWGTTRNGSRAEDSWIGNGDVYGMFFTKEAFDRYNLNKEEYALLKEKEEKEEKEKKGEEEKSAGKKKGKEGKKNEDEKVEALKFDWEGMEERKHRLTVNTSQIQSFVLSKEGDKLFYLTKFEGKHDLWVTELRTKETKLFAKIGAKSAWMELSKSGDFIVVIADGTLKKVDTKSGKVKGIALKGEMVVDKSGERSYIFDHSWRQVKEKFYVEDMQGVDWEFYQGAYSKFLPHINNNYDFAEMLSEMLGELNASHTGSGYRPRGANGDQTASLGVLYDYAHEGDGLKVAEVLRKGPFDKAVSKLKAGHIIEKIDGERITPAIDFYQLLNRKAGKHLLVSVFDPNTKKRWEEVVKPVSLRTENELMYKRWVRTRREKVAALSGGKLGYVHVRGMNDASMREVFQESLGRHFEADALIVDTRFNGGGNLHDVLSDFLNGKKLVEVIPHGQKIGYEPWSRWVKPSIVLMGESNYSDAYLFPEVYKMKNVGKTLGMAVPGTGTFVWWETQIDPTLFFGIPMGGWRPIGRENFFENSQLEPDIKVANTPAGMAAGEDKQLEEAVKELMK